MKFYQLTGILTISLILFSCGGDDKGDSPGGARLPKAIKKIFGDRYMSAVLADFDGDRDLDLMLGAIDGDGNERDELLFNDGTGKFSLAPDENVPLRFGGGEYGTVQLRAVDIDRDGDNDVIAGVHAPLPSDDAMVMIYKNDGSGVFSDASSQIDYSAPPNGFGGGPVIGNLELNDIDQDGDTDILVIQGGTDNAFYLNDGNGNFSFTRFESLFPIEGSVFPQAIHASTGDADGDGDIDVIALFDVYLNNGDNTFELTSDFSQYYDPMFGAVLKNASGGKPIIIGVQFVFLDEIGAPVQAFYINENDTIKNNTSEVFRTERNTIHPRNLYVADFDGNGTEDLIIADTGFDSDPFPGAQNTLFLQNTDGTLVDASNQLPQVSDFTHDIAIGDIDGDGDIDIYAANLQVEFGADQTPYFMINDGTGNFTLED